MKKLSSIILALMVFVSSSFVFSLPVYASGFTTAENVSLDTTFTSVGDTSDPYSLMDASYMDYYRFQVPAKGTVTINLKCRDTDVVPFIRLYRTSNTEDSIWYGYNGNRSSYDYSYSFNGYVSNWSVTLGQGSYYLQVLHDANELGINYYYTLNYKPSLSKAKVTGKKAKPGAIKLSWAKSSNCTGYQIKYSTYSSMKKCKKIKITSKTVTTKTIKKLKRHKKYYIKIRTYKKVTVSGVTKTYYGKWTKTTVKTK